MAGNHKPRRKGGPKALGKILAESKAARSKRYQQKSDRRRYIDNLPLGHPMNHARIEKTFKPLEKVLNEQEATGTMLFDEEGNALMWDEIDQDFLFLVPGLLRMCAVFDMVAAEQAVWGKQPPGLRALALKLANKLALNQTTDVTDARESVAWMRERVAKLSPAAWTGIHDRFVNMEAREREEQHYAQPAA